MPGNRAGTPAKQRSDARRNRERLLEAASRAFAERGLDASLEQIARDAGLAIGTLYRHFPVRTDLIAASYEARLTDFLRQASATLRDEDPWHGLVDFLERLCDLQTRDRGFSEFIGMRFPGRPSFDELHVAFCTLVSEVLGRAQAAGLAREDIDFTDIVSLFWANMRVNELTRDAAPEAWRRSLHLMLDGFQAAAAHELPEPAMSERQLFEAMTRQK